ncbi:zinc finger TRAF-type-containing protein 1-B-like [Rhopilema esculentum]|uniref:zinc finger TRAF-type-containing protein 1-B-like n=1 Tax=Rhopilema esculentum TaxID=499914 RepID=UPI0031D40161
MADVEESITPEGESSACQTIGVSDDQPPFKRRKAQDYSQARSTSDLETRLLRVLSCSVCLDLPSGSIYQCPNGHLSCSGCLSHVLADARLKNEPATCPSCRIEISHKICSRNLAVENAVLEMPIECHFCHTEFSRSQIRWHENEQCLQRISNCKYAVLGCCWEGPKAKQEEHENVCDFPKKTGSELITSVVSHFEKLNEAMSHQKLLVQMMSCEKISICDLQLSPSRTDDFIPKLFYESNRFSAFDQTWIIKAKIQGDEKSIERKFAYQLVCRNKCNLELKYFAVKGPFGDMDIVPELQRFEFQEDHRESVFHPIALKTPSDCNKLLSSKTINLRLLLFLIGK